MRGGAAADDLRWGREKVARRLLRGALDQVVAGQLGGLEAPVGPGAVSLNLRGCLGVDGRAAVAGPLLQEAAAVHLVDGELGHRRGRAAAVGRADRAGASRDGEAVEGQAGPLAGARVVGRQLVGEDHDLQGLHPRLLGEVDVVVDDRDELARLCGGVAEVGSHSRDGQARQVAVGGRDGDVAVLPGPGRVQQAEGPGRELGVGGVGIEPVVALGAGALGRRVLLEDQVVAGRRRGHGRVRRLHDRLVHGRIAGRVVLLRPDAAAAGRGGQEEAGDDEETTHRTIDGKTHGCSCLPRPCWRGDLQMVEIAGEKRESKTVLFGTTLFSPTHWSCIFFPK